MEIGGELAGANVLHHEIFVGARGGFVIGGGACMDKT